MTRTAEDLARLYDAGMPIQAVADRAGMSYRQARRLLLDAGVTFRKPVTAESTLALADDCARLYERGLSVRAVAAQVGYSTRYTHDLIVLGGGQMRDFAGRPRKADAR